MNITNPRQQAIDTITKIETIPDRTKRWRAIQQFIFTLRPDLVPADQAHIAAVKELRNRQERATGSTKQGSMRHLYSLPEFVHAALRMMDPEYERMHHSKHEDAVAVKQYNHAIWRAFPEYRIASKI